MVEASVNSNFVNKNIRFINLNSPVEVIWYIDCTD